MRVLNREGIYEPMLFDKVTERIHSVASGLNVSPDKVAQKVFSSMTDGISTSIIDEISADVAINMITEDPDYETLAVRILVSNMHKNLKGSWPEGVDPSRDYDFSYFGLKTLIKMFLGPGETPQHMFMRVAKGIHGESDSRAVQETYDYMSRKYFTHATPTLFNAGTKSPQLSSCFLTGIKDDSIAGMYDTLKDCALISKWSGGIGVHIHNVRAKGSHIRGTNGTSDGIIPMLRTFNATARHVNQCFRGDTMVLSDIGWVSIERIKAGQDRVMTQDGTFKMVTKVHSRVTTDPLLRVRTKYSSNSVFVTKNHRVFVRKSYDSEDLEEIDANDLVPFVHEMYYPFDKSFSVVTEVTEFVNKGITVFDLTVDTNHNYVTDIGLVHNSGKRKGSFAVYLEPWHADIFDFLELRLNQGDEEARTRDLFTALWIPDLFMKRLEKGQPWSLFCPDRAPGLSDAWGEDFERLYELYESEGRASKTVPIETLWSAVLKSQIETGTPYMLYKDACNRKSNQRHLGTIKSSNLCVAPETKILTRKGYVKIRDLAGQEIEIWNGEEWSMVTVMKTNDSSKLIRINFSDGTSLECTEYHKFHLVDTKSILCANELAPGDKLIKWIPPDVIHYGEDSEYDAYTHGFFCGDGTYHSTYSGKKIIPSASLYGDKKRLINHLDIRTTSGLEDSSGRNNVNFHYNLAPKFHVPINNSVKTRIEWFAGLCDADGTVQRCPGNHTQKSISIASIHLSFLREIQLMLHTMGATSVIGLLHDEGETELPDGLGGRKMFNTQKYWRLTIPALGIEKLIHNGFKPHRLNINDFTPVSRDTRRYVSVVSIENNDRYDETYCFNEPKKHTGIFNGVITGNCTEIVEYTDPNEIAVCNLASLCLPRFVDGNFFDYELLEKVTRIVTRNLDKVIDINMYPVPEAEHSNKKNRPVAIGVQGLADVYQMLGLEFGQGDLNAKIFETIYWASTSESVRLAEEKGPHASFEGSPWSQGLFQFDLWGTGPVTDRYDWESIRARPIRNSLLVGPMPTATTSQIMGNNECFEPYTSNMYLRRTLAGEFVILNKHLVKELKDIGIWNKATKDHIIRDQGSIQGLQGVPDDMKRRYRTVWEIPQKLIIDMAAERGPFVCQSQSMNLHIEDPTVNKLSSMHMYAWKKGLKTGMYYLRTRPKARAIQFTLEPEAPLVCRKENGCVMCSS